MAQFSKNQWIGILLIIAAILSWVPLGPFSSLSQIGPIIVVVIGLYHLLK